MIRPSRDEVFMALAFDMALRSTCERGHVGAVLVKQGQPVAVGYNGAPPGLPHCTDVGCEPVPGAEPGVVSDDYLLKTFGCQRAVHAEQNAIARAARMGVATAGCTVFCTHAPCRACAQSLAASGITRVVYAKPYRAARLDILEHSGIAIQQLEPITEHC